MIGLNEAPSVLFALTGVIAVAVIAARLTIAEDRSWLPKVLVIAYIGKLVASLIRWSVLVFVYGGSGDATGYHGAGVLLVSVWRGFEVPEIAIGTKFVDAATGFLYIPYVPTMIGGFFVFATIAFVGQVLLYLAFRRCDTTGRLGWYAAGVLFLPTIVYWPSSIGKEALMFLFLGLSSYGAAGLLKNQRLGSVVPLAIGLAGAAIIRPHVALLLVGSLTVALILGARPSGERSSARRIITLGTVGAILAVVTLVAAANFGIEFSSGDTATEGIDRVIGNVEDNTSGGGSGVEGGAISSPADFPSGFVKVLFRPFPTEATTLPVMASSIEGMLLLGLLLWRLIPMIKNFRHIRRHVYALYSFVFTIGFVVAFSAFNNLGLLARQRSQVMPFFLAVVITLGWASTESDPQRAAPKERPANAFRG